MRTLVLLTLLFFVSQTSSGAEQIPPIDIGGMKLCPNGFRLDGSLCNRIDIPANATPIGRGWMCIPGYKKDGNRCAQVDIPDNAIPTLGGWICKVGYNQSQGLCVQKPWAELNNTAEFLLNKSIRTQGACEKLCDLHYYGDREEECNRFCKGDIQTFPR